MWRSLTTFERTAVVVLGAQLACIVTLPWLEEATQDAIMARTAYRPMVGLVYMLMTLTAVLGFAGLLAMGVAVVSERAGSRGSPSCRPGLAIGGFIASVSLAIAGAGSIRRGIDREQARSGRDAHDPGKP